MRPTRLLTATFVAWSALAWPAPATADIFVSPFLGVKFRGDTNQLDLDRSNGARDTKSAVGISGVIVSDMGLGVDVDLAHQSRFFESQGSTGLVTRSGVTTLSGNALVALPLSITRESLRPYAVIGLGWMHASANDELALNNFSNDFLGLTLGVGAIGFVSDVVGLRFDVRRLRSVTSADTSNLSGDRARLRFWRATVGVVFR